MEGIISTRRLGQKAHQEPTQSTSTIMMQQQTSSQQIHIMNQQPQPANSRILQPLPSLHLYGLFATSRAGLCCKAFASIVFRLALRISEPDLGAWRVLDLLSPSRDSHCQNLHCSNPLIAIVTCEH
jgi:hypothetical protein